MMGVMEGVAVGVMVAVLPHGGGGVKVYIGTSWMNTLLPS
jgi:hypothetical protein